MNRSSKIQGVWEQAVELWAAGLLWPEADAGVTASCCRGTTRVLVASEKPTEVGFQTEDCIEKNLLEAASNFSGQIHWWLKKKDEYCVRGHRPGTVDRAAPAPVF